MGYINEPKEIDFVVDPTPLTIEERKKISDIISHYKKTGRKKKISKLTKKHSGKIEKSSIKNSRKKSVTS
jgi:hypothetical protein